MQVFALNQRARVATMQRRLDGLIVGVNVERLDLVGIDEHIVVLRLYGDNTGNIANSIKPAYICDVWQYTSRGSIGGINGNVDLNVITGDGKHLSWFLDGEDNTPAPEPTKTASGSVLIQNGNVNVRTLPNTCGAIIGVAFNDDTLPYGGVTADNGWLSVIFNGKSGWVSNKYGRLV